MEEEIGKGEIDAANERDQGPKTSTRLGARWRVYALIE